MRVSSRKDIETPKLNGRTLEEKQCIIRKIQASANERKATIELSQEHKVSVETIRSWVKERIYLKKVKICHGRRESFDAKSNASFCHIEKLGQYRPKVTTMKSPLLIEVSRTLERLGLSFLQAKFTKHTRLRLMHSIGARVVHTSR